MNHATHDPDTSARPERAMDNDNGSTPDEQCPDGTPWCRRHEDGICWSRSVLVGEETLLDISNGNPEGRLKLYGLSDLDTDGLGLEVALQVAAAITLLAEEVER